MNVNQSGVVYDHPMPRLVRVLGGRWRNGRTAYRMSWGELSFGERGWALALCLFGDGPHFSLHVHALRVNLFITLPFLRAFAREPHEMMESWGVRLFDGSVSCNWGRHTKFLHLPWREWVQVAHEVRRPDGSWVPFVGSWECAQPLKDGTIRPGKDPDGRQIETYPYRYLTRAGEVQERTATISVERRVRRLRWLRALPFGRTRYAIDVAFNDEVGERVGSWKGGCVGCGYELRPDETPRECLKRMESERKFT